MQLENALETENNFPVNVIGNGNWRRAEATTRTVNCSEIRWHLDRGIFNYISFTAVMLTPLIGFYSAMILFIIFLRYNKVLHIQGISTNNAYKPVKHYYCKV